MTRLAPAAALLALGGCAAVPAGYMGKGGGSGSAMLHPLAIGFTAIAFAVMAIIALLIALAVVRSRRAARAEGAVVARGKGGLDWIKWGVGLSFPVLLAMAVWSFAVTRAVGQVPPGTPLVIEVTAHRWWWEARYRGDVAGEDFTTANDIEIPVGRPVRLILRSADVIHDFWVPRLGPKMDMIPGQVNQLVLRAEVPGDYLGECAEFCGMEHGMMRFHAIALDPAAFARWAAATRAPALVADPAMPRNLGGEAKFVAACSSCHEVRGTAAGGVFGPDLTHFASRTTIAAGVLPNTPAMRERWLAHTQEVKPGAMMPLVPMADADRAALVAYLGELR